MEKKEISEDLVEGIRSWLQEDGIKFFREVKEKYGRVDAVWMDGPVPHPVHFREGMHVRNKMRELTNNEWHDFDYDENWMEVVERAIKV